MLGVPLLLFEVVWCAADFVVSVGDRVIRYGAVSLFIVCDTGGVSVRTV